MIVAVGFAGMLVLAVGSFLNQLTKHDQQVTQNLNLVGFVDLFNFALIQPEFSKPTATIKNGFYRRVASKAPKLVIDEAKFNSIDGQPVGAIYYRNQLLASPGHVVDQYRVQRLILRQAMGTPSSPFGDGAIEIKVAIVEVEFQATNDKLVPQTSNFTFPIFLAVDVTTRRLVAASRVYPQPEPIDEPLKPIDLLEGPDLSSRAQICNALSGFMWSVNKKMCVLKKAPLPTGAYCNGPDPKYPKVDPMYRFVRTILPNGNIRCGLLYEGMHEL
jgi:hypothetical protein